MTSMYRKPSSHREYTMIRKPTVRGALACALAALAVAPLAAQTDDRHISFVACPILQDTNTVPCWLAEYEGETYFLGIQTDASGWSPPWLGHKLLVEGTVSANPRVCGGIVLESSGTLYDKRVSGSSAGVELPNPPITSVMREIDSSCRTMLPEDPRFNTIDARRGPGPNEPPQPRPAGAAAPARPAPEVPQPPFTEREYEMLYDFDSELAVFTINRVQEAMRYAAAIKASAISITGYRASSLLSNGESLEEAPFIAERRARELENSLRMLGLPEGTRLDVSWEDEPLPGNGRDDWSRRRALVRVIP